ncbi:hypothetical protein VTN02DRAFT_5763 [Thermoascus thermophilus]
MVPGQQPSPEGGKWRPHLGAYDLRIDPIPCVVSAVSVARPEPDSPQQQQRSAAQAAQTARTAQLDNSTTQRTRVA